MKPFYIHFLKFSSFNSSTHEEEVRHRWKFICDGSEIVADEIVMKCPVKTLIRDTTPLGVIEGEGNFKIEYYGENKRIRITIE